MAKQIVLLAGLHKTGTTSIQRTCFQNRRLLRRAGFLYPSYLIGEYRESNHSELLKFMFRQSPHRRGLLGQFEVGDQDVAKAFGAALRERLATALRETSERTLLVAEGVSVFSVEELTHLRTWFLEQGWEIRVICHVRNVDSWLNSMVAQRVVGSMRLTIAAAINEFVKIGGLVQPRIERIRRVFPNAEFYSHEQCLEHRLGPVGSFLEKLAVTLDTDLQVVRANEGRSDCATRLKSIVNEKFAPFDARGHANSEGFTDKAAMARLNRIPGAKFTLRASEVAPLFRVLHAENHWLADTFGREFASARLEFGSAPCDWSDESIKQLVAFLKAAPPNVRAWVEAHLAALDIVSLPAVQ